MTEDDDPLFSISKDDTRLVFRTQNFTAGRGSVLHSGIYNREFSSVLASFSVAGLVFFMLAMRFGKENILYPVALLLFVVTFPLFRKYLFRERNLETVLDRKRAEVSVSLSWTGNRVLVREALSDITGLRIDTRKDEVVNRDGVEFVERISAMHGTVIPGFGEEATFYSLVLSLNDGREMVIFADSNADKVLAVYDEMKEFLKI